MRARLADERGFTIVEVLTAMVVGLVVLGAAFVLVGRASDLQAKTQNRVDAHQRGRAALEAMVTELRSGTCAMTADGTSYPPIVHPGPQGITENVVSAVKAARNGPRM